MTLAARVEQALEAAVSLATGPDAPPRLAGAIRYSVFPGGARVRPQLCLAVAAACGDDDPDLSDAAAAAIEFLHCASLVHDDLPCFDNADLRRGKASVHARYDVPLALLAGDALIVMAFETLGRAGASSPLRLAPLIATVARGVGAPSGIVAGQAWESEIDPPLDLYHSAKTGALFMAATMAGAVAAGSDAGPWRALGANLGAAYQVADDLLDAIAHADDCDKPTGRDVALHRPSAVSAYGMKGAVARLEGLVKAAVESIPPCAGAKDLRDLVRMQAVRLAPKHLARSAA
ncbi:MAG: polyprenyl synthetase family protein [Hyphomonadaceae bacterium]|nr:polyprenyl synthetase family protein [Hyphomonadaceae bacterium]